MMRRRVSSLVSLKEIATDPRRAAEAQAERRIARVWPHIVGPALVRHTRLIRVRNHTLVVGCWRMDVMNSLRQSAEAAWPHVRARLERLLKLKLQHLEIVPCDPPEDTLKPVVIGDPLELVLRKYRALNNQRWTPKKK